MISEVLRHNLRQLELLEDLTTRLFTLEKIPMEEKIIAAFEEESSTLTLEPWEISDIVTETLHKLQNFLPAENVDVAFDVIYDAISAALTRARRGQ